MANLQFIPATSVSTVSTLNLDEIPQEIRDDAEQVYQALKTNPGRMRVNFDTIAELKAYETQIKAYCALRPGGKIRFRKSPTRELPKTSMDFRITDVTEGEEATEGIREAVEAVKAAPAKAAKPAK